VSKFGELKMIKILEILDKIEFSSDANVLSGHEYQKYELLGDVLIKEYLILRLYEVNSVGDMQKIFDKILCNANLCKIYNELRLNETFFVNFVHGGKSMADKIEMIVGKSFVKFGREYSNEALDYLFDIEIHSAIGEFKKEEDAAKKFGNLWLSKFGIIKPKFDIEYVNGGTAGRLRVGDKILAEVFIKQKESQVVVDCLKKKFVENAKLEEVLCR
jgi:hypothetical protein